MNIKECTDDPTIAAVTQMGVTMGDMGYTYR